MLAGALLLLAQPAPPPSVPAPPPSAPSPAPSPSPACPAAATGFAPPLDRPLTLTRRIERPLAQGSFVQTVTYALAFTRSGRGYRMRWQQTGQQSSGPAELLRLLSLQEESAEGEILDFSLDASGALLGVSESADSPQRLARAIARLRADPALNTRPGRERAAIGAMLDRIAALPASERAHVHLALASRLVQFAARPCLGGELALADGSRFQITGQPGEWLDLAGAIEDIRADGSRIASTATVRLSARTGLVQRHHRSTTSLVAGSARSGNETLVLEGLTDHPKP